MKDYLGMSDFEINKAVDDILHPPKSRHVKAYNSNYCNNPADAWPIITANKISIIPRMDLWVAVKCSFVIDIDTPKLKSFIHASHSLNIPFCVNENPLKAAMIVYLQMMEQKS
ncbi:MAG: hypothetical protein [Bacteriophage sp.]|nr:MAG: hypothetical protein [Bacteriophage sp.]